MSERVDAQYKALRANFRRIEHREWWLWASAFVITLLLTVALASFLLPGAYFHQDFTSQHMMSDATDVVLMHHERFDGSGCPQGLKGEQIPLSARIFAISDTLDAITSERPYQRASSFQFARERIQQLSGTGFDPQVASLFMNIPEETWPAIASNQRRTAGVTPELSRDPSMLRIGLGGLIPD